MSLPKWILIGTVSLFSIIGITAMMKRGERKTAITDGLENKPIDLLPRVESPVLSVPVFSQPSAQGKKNLCEGQEGGVSNLFSSVAEAATSPLTSSKDDFPSIDRIFQLFTTTGASRLPIVETINYASSVPWLKGRPAWIADYATYYNTSRHFIARSLNGKPDYFSQKVSEGSKFNVFRKDKRVNFYLLADVSRCKMGFYYVDLDTNERVLLKTYRIGLGRIAPSEPSGSLTPLGRYFLGSRVAIYKPGVIGAYQDQKIEMIRIFGTRWIPLDQEQERMTASKGYGLQGAPWTINPENGQWVEQRNCVGAYDSDGCIRLNSEDIEELFAIVLTKPTYIEIVKDFHEAKLPGVEVAAPSR